MGSENGDAVVSCKFIITKFICEILEGVVYLDRSERFQNALNHSLS